MTLPPTPVVPARLGATVPGTPVEGRGRWGLRSTIGRHINKGIYDVAEASRLLGIPRDRLDRWSGSDTADGVVVQPEHGDGYSFADIVTLYVTDELLLRGVPEGAIRATHDRLARRFGTRSPFAHERLPATGAGTDEAHCLELARPVLRPLEYGPEGLACLWRPAPLVWLNVRVQAGAPCIDGTRIPTLLVAALVDTGDERDDVADDYGLTRDQVDAALRFEHLLAA